MVNALTLAKVDYYLRPLLERVLPSRNFIQLYSATRNWYLDQLSSCRLDVTVPLRPVEFCGLTFRNDIINAAGLDKNGDLLEFNYLLGAGGAIIGTTLSHENDGNAILVFNRHFNPWCPLPNSASAINSLNLPSKGIDYAVKNIRNFRSKFNPENFPIGVSVMYHPRAISNDAKLETLESCLKKALKIADFIEINESCPNTHTRNGQERHTHEGMKTRLERAVGIRNDHKGKYVPVFVKLRDFGNFENTIQFFSEIGVDGLTDVNTQINYDQLIKKIDERDKSLFEYYYWHYKGGVSGEIIKEFSYDQTKEAAEVIRKTGSSLKLMHVGGLESVEDFNGSRKIDSEIVIVKQWLTGLMHCIGKERVDTIYKSRVENELHISD